MCELFKSTEVIEWKHTDDFLPDDELVVLIDMGHDVFFGSHECDQWYYNNGAKVESNVIAWAYLPQGTQGGESC